MKKHFSNFILCSFFILTACSSYGQTLSLDSIAGFPDSVQDNDQRTMTLRFSTSGTAFVGDLAILMNSVSHDSVPDSLYYSPHDSIGGNGFIDTMEIGYTFRAADLDGGDNIIVVWPVSSQGSVVQDSLLFHLFLRTVGVVEIEKLPEVFLYPVPSGDLIHLHYAQQQNVEEVRISDAIGRQVKQFSSAVSSFSIRDLNAGIYFATVRFRDGTMVVKKFFRE